MYGEITKFRSDIGIGIIRAEDGRKYRFDGNDVRNRFADLEGVEVYFETASVKASDVILLAGSPWTALGGVAQ